MFAEDLTPFFSDFALPCSVAGVHVRAIFDDAGALGAVGTAGMTTSQPVIVVPTADLPGDAQGAAVIVNGRSYVTAQIDDDGTGITRLHLEAA